MSVGIINPKVVMICYQTDNMDEEKRLWADFLFDITNHRLHINSNCGNFSGDWSSDKEPFLPLMRHISSDDLLERIAVASVINKEKTIKNFKQLFQPFKDQIEFREIEDIVLVSNSLTELIDHVMRSLSIEVSIEWVCQVCESVELDYPQNAKIIADIFKQLQEILPSAEKEI